LAAECVQSAARQAGLHRPECSTLWLTQGNDQGEPYGGTY